MHSLQRILQYGQIKSKVHKKSPYFDSFNNNSQPLFKYQQNQCASFRKTKSKYLFETKKHIGYDNYVKNIDLSVMLQEDLNQFSNRLHSKITQFEQYGLPNIQCCPQTQIRRAKNYHIRHKRKQRQINIESSPKKNYSILQKKYKINNEFPQKQNLSLTAQRIKQQPILKKNRQKFQTHQKIRIKSKPHIKINSQLKFNQYQHEISPWKNDPLFSSSHTHD